MASKLLRLASNIYMMNYPLKKMTTVPIRHAVTSETGAVLPKPEKMPFGPVRVLLTVLPGLYLGATISKEGAAFLEENDIFVPDEDDDED
ncbi:essential MCU regulator, mitochondrial-like [Argiope bruennichi]|uniref:essential MCU regulator, mitochondrial-like n=1 Tax=Argiope bruennichi TaxID=94029 RepID=UPI002494EBE9|nr:essential MCU regulator, mitochondrial-like [Argiope bruennichi]